MAPCICCHWAAPFVFIYNKIAQWTFDKLSSARRMLKIGLGVSRARKAFYKITFVRRKKQTNYFTVVEGNSAAVMIWKSSMSVLYLLPNVNWAVSSVMAAVLIQMAPSQLTQRLQINRVPRKHRKNIKWVIF